MKRPITAVSGLQGTVVPSRGLGCLPGPGQGDKTSVLEASSQHNQPTAGRLNGGADHRLHPLLSSSPSPASSISHAPRTHTDSCITNTSTARGTLHNKGEPSPPPPTATITAPTPSMSNSQLTSATAFSPSLEAIKLAAQMYNAAREGNKKVLEQAILEGMPPNLTNEKGDTLVSLLAGLCCSPSLSLSRPLPSLFFPSHPLTRRVDGPSGLPRIEINKMGY